MSYDDEETVRAIMARLFPDAKEEDVTLLIGLFDQYADAVKRQEQNGS